MRGTLPSESARVSRTETFVADSDRPSAAGSRRTQGALLARSRPIGSRWRRRGGSQLESLSQQALRAEPDGGSGGSLGSARRTSDRFGHRRNSLDWIWLAFKPSFLVGGRLARRRTAKLAGRVRPILADEKLKRVRIQNNRFPAKDDADRRSRS